MTRSRSWVSNIVMIFALAAMLSEDMLTLVQASLPPPSSNDISVAPICEDGCTCENIYQLIECTHLNLPSIPYETVRNNTRILRLSGNSIQFLHRNTLRRYRQLRLLNLAQNHINQITEDAFMNQPKLIHLDLSNNRLPRLPVAALAYLRSLRTLVLDGNNITYLGPNSFVNLTKLQNLSLSYVGLQALDPSAFAGLVSLRVLKVDGNSLQEIPSGSLSDCARMDYLSASFNRIGTFVNDSESLTVFSVRSWFGATVPNRLRTLILSNNYIDMFSHSCFKDMVELTDLDLSSNYILEIPVDLFQDLEMLETLKLSRNSPLHTLPSGLFHNNVNLVMLKIRYSELLQLPADLFRNHSFLDILDLTGNGLSDTSFISSKYLVSLTKLFIGNNEIESMSAMCLSGLTYLEILDLSGNRLTHLPKLNSLISLYKLDVSNNYLTQLDDDAFSGTSVFELDLTGNNLHSFKQSTFLSIPDAVSAKIYFDDNPFFCDCHLLWTLDTEFQGFMVSDYIKCVWPKPFDKKTIYEGDSSGANLVCTSYPKRTHLYFLIGTWFGVVSFLILVFWAAVFHHARRRFRARQPRERFLLFKNPTETNAGCTSTTGMSNVRFKALDSETESLDDDETTV